MNVHTRTWEELQTYLSCPRGWYLGYWPRPEWPRMPHARTWRVPGSRTVLVLSSEVVADDRAALWVAWDGRAALDSPEAIATILSAAQLVSPLHGFAVSAEGKETRYVPRDAAAEKRVLQQDIRPLCQLIDHAIQDQATPRHVGVQCKRCLHKARCE